MAFKKWNISDADKEKASAISEKFNIDPFVAYLLAARGIESDITISEFLSNEIRLSDPFDLLDMDKAVERIENAVQSGEKITVYGDYDCDGVTATVLLYSFLCDMGADANFYIPSREGEGYGLNKTAIKSLHDSGTSLIITVDNGISAISEAEYIYSLGMQLVVTDHHRVPAELPVAEALVNPHRQDGELPFTDFAGVGVAFKLVCALYGDVDDMLDRYADLVAIGTIGDIMPLVDENRSFVKAGLRLINLGSRVGLSALKNIAGYSDKKVGSGDVAFALCPRINATGRIDNAMKAASLLLCDDLDDSRFMAEQLDINNNHRRKLEEKIEADVLNQLSAYPELVAGRIIVVAGEGYHQGVVGIVASSITERYGKPSIVLDIDEEDNAKGSARSIDGFNIYDAIASCSDILDHFGGHTKAAGLSLSANKINEFRQRINDYAFENYSVMPVQSIDIDFKISPFYLDLGLAKNLSVFEPYGEGNKRAVFALTGLNLTGITPMGGGKHIRLECDKKGKKVRIVYFGVTEEEFPFKQGDKIDCAVKIGVNPYNGREYLSVQAIDIHKHGIDQDKYLAEKSVYELFVLNKNNDSSVYPPRNVCAAVYKALRERNNLFTDEDNLYFDLTGITYGQMMFALDAFYETGLAIKNGSNIKLRTVGKKVDLANTEVIKALKGRIGVDN